MLKKIKKSDIFSFILGALIFGTLIVGATSLIYSNDVTYYNGNSGLSSNDVQNAIDELAEELELVPVCDGDGDCTVTCTKGKSVVVTDTGYKCSITAKKTMQKLNVTAVTSGDGLYADTVTSGRYYYRGENVDNYIVFNYELWRILSIESDGTLKIVRNEPLDDTYQWDAPGIRDSSTSTYCTNASDYGCNAWAATSNLVGTPSSFTQYFPFGNTSDSEETYSGTVTEDAYLNTFLNETYYDSLSDDYKSKVVKGTFNVSTPGIENDADSLETDAEQEKQYQWKGYVALYTVTELLRASTTSGCSSLAAGVESDYCNSNNWLWPTNDVWTLSPSVYSIRGDVWIVQSGGCVDRNIANFDLGACPVLHLTSDISLSGTGTSSDPYEIS